MTTRRIFNACFWFTGLIFFSSYLSLGLSKILAGDSFTVTAPSFEATFDHRTYTFLELLQRELKIWTMVKNTSSSADTIRFSFIEPGGKVTPGGFVHLEAGEQVAHEVAHVSWEMRGESDHLTFELKMESERNPASAVSASIRVNFVSLDVTEAARAKIIVNVYDSQTKETIADPTVFYYTSAESRTERARPLGEGKNEITVIDSGALAEFSSQNGRDWPGYTVEVQAAGYEVYVEERLKPTEADSITRDIYLTPLSQSVDFQASWLEKLDYPGVWRVRPTKNWDYLAVAMGKHPDPWDQKPPVPTSVYLFKANGELVWKYPLPDTVWGMDVAPDGSLVAAGTNNGKLYVIDTTGKLVWSKDLPSMLREVRFSNNGTYLSVEANPIQIFDAKTGGIFLEYDSGIDTHWRGITFRPDDKQVAIAGAGALILLDLETRKLLWQKYISGVPYDVKFTADFSRIVVADKGDTLWSYSRQGDLLWRKPDLTVLTDMDMTADGSQILTLSHDGTLRMFDRDGNLIWRRAFGSAGHNGLDMTADGKYIVVGGGFRDVFRGEDFPYAMFLLDGDGNLLWKHSESGPISDPYHPYLISAMTVAVSEDGSKIVAGYGTGNPGIQFFTSGIGEGREEAGWLQSKIIVIIAGGLGIAGAFAAFLVARRLRKR